MVNHSRQQICLRRDMGHRKRQLLAHQSGSHWELNKCKNHWRDCQKWLASPATNIKQEQSLHSDSTVPWPRQSTSTSQQLKDTTRLSIEEKQTSKAPAPNGITSRSRLTDMSFSWMSTSWSLQSTKNQRQRMKRAQAQGACMKFQSIYLTRCLLNRLKSRCSNRQASSNSWRSTWKSQARQNVLSSTKMPWVASRELVQIFSSPR